VTDPDLVEWDEWQNRRVDLCPKILCDRPDWQLFGTARRAVNLPKQVGERPDRVVELVRSIQGDVLLFSSGHFIRMLTARWLGLAAEPAASTFF
jgi:broad specificity phosphatase PhoE